MLSLVSDQRNKSTPFYHVIKLVPLLNLTNSGRGSATINKVVVAHLWVQSILHNIHHSSSLFICVN